MLQDQYRESSKIENEYKKLLTAWEHKLSNNSPSTGIKKSKISKAEHVQFTLMHLFNGYLDQIWTDSQNMLQCAQAWTNQQNTSLYPEDAIFTMNILGLHLMKQSLRTRQEFFSIVDELNGISSLKSQDADDDSCSSSDSTISQDLFIHQKDQQHMFVDLDQQQQLGNNISNIYYSNSQQVLDGYFELTKTKDRNIHKDFSSNASSLSLEINNRPIRLTSSPSTPTVSKNWPEITSCSQNFTPACNYSIYFPRDQDDDDVTTHKLSCHFCQETVPLKKSFSADNLYSLQQHLVNTTDDEVSDDDDDIEKEEVGDNGSSFEIASFYYNSGSDNEQDMVEREQLLQKTEHTEKYQLLLNENPTQGSLKIQFEEQYDNSSSIIHYDSASKEIKKNKISKKKKRYNHGLVNERGDSSSTCLPQSTYSSEEDGKSNSSSSSDIKTPSSSSPTKLSSIQAIADTNSSSCNTNDDSILLVKDDSKLSSILLRKSKVAAAFMRNNNNNNSNKKRKMKDSSETSCNTPFSSVARSFSSKNLCNLFSTRKN